MSADAGSLPRGAHRTLTAANPEDERMRLGMWVFIGSEILFFAALLFGYALARAAHPEGFMQASRHTEVVIGTANTVILLCSSAAIALASEASALGARRVATGALAITLVLGLAFMVLKAIEYAHDWHEGLFPGPGFHLPNPHADLPGAELFFMLYYVMTSIHALHLSIGLAVIAWLIFKDRHRSMPSHARRIDATALYWHFVDVVWILLYPLLYLINRS